MGTELGITGEGEAGDPGTTPDEDGWDTGGAVMTGNVGISTVAGALATGGVVRVWSFKLFGGSGKSQGRGTRAAGIIQVAAHITPLPRSCALIELNS
jgi:hypothetical protein